MKNKSYKIEFIVFMISALVLAVGYAVLAVRNVRLEKELEFESMTIKEGLCIYIEYNGTSTNSKPVYCLVADMETERIIEVDIDSQLLHKHVSVGDTIIYSVDRNYTDADFINFIEN